MLSFQELVEPVGSGFTHRQLFGCTFCSQDSSIGEPGEPISGESLQYISPELIQSELILEMYWICELPKIWDDRAVGSSSEGTPDQSRLRLKRRYAEEAARTGMSTMCW